MKTRQKRGWHEHFVGELRVNSEIVPRLPAWAVRWVLDDPRGSPYLLLWRTEDRPISGIGEFAEAVRVSALPGRPPPICSGEEWVSVTQHWRMGFVHALRLLRRPLPRHGGKALFLLCPRCGKPRRYLYAWGVAGPRLTPRPWHCRSCAGLRFASEGEGRNPWGPYPRDPWDPYVFSSVKRAAEALGLR